MNKVEKFDTHVIVFTLYWRYNVLGKLFNKRFWVASLYSSGDENMVYICGVEIKANEAIIVLVQIIDGQGIFKKAKFSKIALSNDDQHNYKSFSDTFNEFLRQNSISTLYLKKPMDKGRQIAGPNAFRIEALINLAPVSVKEIHAVKLANFIKKNELTIASKDECNKYQEGALWAAMWGLMNG